MTHQNTRHVKYLGPVAQLEDRTVPIVGQYIDLDATFVHRSSANQFLAAPLAAPNTGLDGVVYIDLGGYLGTGSLFSLDQGQSWGHHILSARHVLSGVAGNAKFEMFRYVAGGPLAVVPITIPIQAGKTFQIEDPNNADIAIARIVDPVGDPSATRFLVAPAGAERFGLYSAANESKLQVKVVGYGNSGDGARGAEDGALFYTPGGRKRWGVNQIDDVTATILKFDFDSGKAAHDALGGPDYGIPGIAAGKSADIGTAEGDSGGPALIGNLIAGVLVTGGNAYGPDTTWGDISEEIRISQFRGFIDPVATIGRNYDADGVPSDPPSGAYDVVLDMKYQVYGQAGTAGEKLTITAKQVDGFLELHVTGPDAAMDAKGQYNGQYYRAPIANIKTLTIRGTDDNETFKIQGDLGISGNVYIDGKGGVDSLVIDDLATAADAAGRHYTMGENNDPGYDVRISRAKDGGATKLPGIDILGVQKYVFDLGPSKDIVRIEKVPTPPAGAPADNGVHVNAGAGGGTVHVGEEGVSMSAVEANVYVNGGADRVELYYHDTTAALDAAGRNYTFEDSAVAGWALQLSRAANGGAAHQSGIYSKAISKHTLNTGPSVDLIKIKKAPAEVLNGFFINSGAAKDLIHVGVAGGDMSAIATDIYVDGGADLAELTYHDTTAALDAAGRNYTFGPSGGWSLQLSRASKGGDDPLSGVRSKNIIKHTLNTGISADRVIVEKTPAEATGGVFVDTAGGSDTITVGSAGTGFGSIGADVTVTGGGNFWDVLILDDSPTPGASFTVSAGKIVEALSGRTIYNTDVLFRKVMTGDEDQALNVIGVTLQPVEQ